ncbi:MAG: hypothetical protein WC009_02525 [Methylotenera sp.]|jgi:hypothetical protein
MNTRVRRPAGVWIITVLFGLLYFGKAVSVAYMYLSDSPAAELGRQYYANLSVVENVVQWGGFILIVISLVYLFLLKNTAFYLFVLNFVLGIMFTAREIITSRWFSYAENQLGTNKATAPLLLTGLAISFAMVMYVWHLKKKGMLSA